MSDLLVGVLSSLIATPIGFAIGYFVKAKLLWLKYFFDSTAEEQAKLISGKWNAKETFTDGSGSTSNFILELECQGALVSGTQTCTSAKEPERIGEVFFLSGSFENHVLNTTWKKPVSLESGTVSLYLVKDKILEGHGLYVLDRKVYTSTFTAKKSP